MRSLLTWFNARRRLVALALIGLIAVIVVSAGRTPENDEWIRIPNLSGLLVIGLAFFALLGLVLLGFARPKKAATRKPGEIRSLRAVLVFTILVVAATQLFGPSDELEEQPVVETEQPVVTEGVGEAVETAPESNPADTAALALILLVAVVVLIRTLRRSRADNVEPPPDTSTALREELAPAVDEAHHHLDDETDPKTAVLLAYASLENALAELDLDRIASETPSEHMARVLVDIPVLSTPAIQLGKLYEIARFSNADITEDQRTAATEALDRARIFMPAPSVVES